MLSQSRMEMRPRDDGAESREAGGFGKKQCRLRQESERAVENGVATHWRVSECTVLALAGALKEPSHFATLRSSN